MSVFPALWSVDAVDRMMKYMMRFEKNIPIFTSRRVCLSSSSVAPRRCDRRVRPIAISSSTSWFDCHVYR
jgi:hypothetical protein